MLIPRVMLAPALAAFVVFLTAGAAQAQPLDPASMECLDCHETYLDIQGGLMRVSHASGTGHAIGGDYASAASRTAALAAPETLPAGMTLPGGMVGCTTCHIPYNASDHESLSAARASRAPGVPDPMLSIDNTGSALCLACHRK